MGEKIVEIDGIDVSPSESPSMSSMWATAFRRRCWRFAVDVPSMCRKHSFIGKNIDIVDVVGFFPILRFLVCINGLSSQRVGAGNRRQYQRRFLQPFSAL